MKEESTQMMQNESGCPFPETLNIESMFSFLQDSIDESEAAIETAIDCFMQIHTASSKLEKSEGLSNHDRVLTETICQQIPTIISAFQFQDRLKQRFTHVKLIASSGYHLTGKGNNKDGVQMDNHMDLLSEQSAEMEITLFSEAA